MGSKAMILSLFVVATTCDGPLLCRVVLGVFSSLAIILLRKRELAAFL